MKLLFWLSTLLVANWAAEIEVTFPSTDIYLEGTLYLPDGVPTPVPGVVLVHGSGPQSRASPLEGQLGMPFGFTIEVFTEIAQGLQERGIAVLVYDKRSCITALTGCGNNSYPVEGAANYTTADFIDDAAAANDFLFQRSDISDVFVVGHSQSGQFIPGLLVDQPDLKGGVLLAGPYRSIDKLLAYQLDLVIDMLLKQGLTLEQINAIGEVELLRNLTDETAAIANGTFNGTPAVGTLEFWEGWIALANQSQMDAALAAQPLLLVQGEADTNVPPSEFEMWVKWLDEVRPDNYETALLPCITHIMNCVTMTNGSISDIGMHVDVSVIDALADFIIEEQEQPPANGTSAASYVETLWLGTLLLYAYFSTDVAAR